MKKILCFLSIMFLLTGCGKTDTTSIIKDFQHKIDNIKAYELKGTMTINNDEDNFKYDLNVAYKYPDYYKVSLINQINNHEQIILKNKEGVFVVTPALNKSFKFQSEWPENSSQSYLLSSIANDLSKEAKPQKIKDKKYTALKVKVNYPNNQNLSYQYIYLDKLNLKKVEVYDKDKKKKIIVEIKNIDYKAKFADKEFEVDNNITSSKEEVKETSALDDIIFPLYIPNNTYLTSKDIVNTDKGQRAILTFSGDKSFILVEEVASIPVDTEIIPVYGEPHILNDSLAALSETSLSWTSNGIDYYLSSNKLSSDEMISVATSLTDNYEVEVAGK